MDEKFLRDGIAYITACIERIGEQAKAESRARTDAEKVDVDAGVAWIRDAHDQLERLAEIRKMADKVGAEPGEFRAEAVNVNRNPDPFDLNTLNVFDKPALRGRAREVIERVAEFDDGLRQSALKTFGRAVDPSGELALRVAITGTDTYRSAFAKAMSNQMWALTTDEQRTLERAASLTGNAGGFAVPFTLDPTIIYTNTGVANSFRQVSRVVTITTDQWNGVSSAGVTASWDGEAAEVSDDAPTLAQPSINVHKAQAFVPFSIEIGMDWAAMESDVRGMFLDARDRLEGAAFTLGAGDGSNQPTGIITALDGTASELTEVTSETFTDDDVYKTLTNLPPRFRRTRDQAVWMAHLGTMNAIRQFDTGGGGAFWTNLVGPEPERLLGYRIYENSSMDDATTINAAVTEDNFILVLGDFSNYVIVDRAGMNVELVPHLFATANNRPSGQRGFYAWWRVGADSVNDAAFRVMNVNTTA